MAADGSISRVDLADHPSAGGSAPDAPSDAGAFHVAMAAVQNRSLSQPPAANAAPARAGDGPQPRTAPAIGAGLTDEQRRAVDAKVAALPPLGPDKAASEAMRRDLDALPPAQQRYYMDRVLTSAPVNLGGPAARASHLALAVAGRPALAGMASERLALNAVDVSNQAAAARVAGEPRAQVLDDRASHTAAAAVQVAQGGAPAGDPAGQHRLRELVNALGSQGAGDFACAAEAESPQAVASVLGAVNAGPQTPAAGAFTRSAFLALRERDYANAPGLATGMGAALGREWNPADPAAASRDGGRMGAILSTPQGRALLAQPDGGDGQPVDRRAELAAVRRTPGITAQSLGATDDVWRNPQVMQAVAHDRAQAFLTGRGDTALPQRGTDLDNTVGAALGLGVTLPRGVMPQQAEAGAARGTFSLYAAGPDGAGVRKIADAIRAVGGPDAKVTVLPVQYSDGAAGGVVRMPLFRVEGADGSTHLVDNQGMHYANQADWLKSTPLPAGMVTFPAGMHMQAGPDGAVRLESHVVHDGFAERWGNRILTGVGVVAGGAAVFGTGGLAAPLVLAGVGAIGAARAGGNLWDRAQHGGSIDPLHDSTARGMWLDLGANASGVLAFGAAAQVARLGSEASAGLQLGSRVAGIGAGVMNTAATAATAHQLVTGWNQMSPEQRLEAGVSVAFWGAGAMAGLRTGMRPYDLPAQREQIAFEAAPITRDSTMPAGQVHVEYAADPNGGPPSVHIRASETATPHDIELHVAAAQRLQSYKRTGEWPVGSRAYEAHHEIAKVDQYIAAAQAERARPGITPGRRAQLDQEIQGYRTDRAEYEGTLREANLNPGLGLVAAPPSRGMVAAGGMTMKDGGGRTLAQSVPDGYELFWNRAVGDGRVDIRRKDASDTSTPPRGLQAVDTPEGVKWEIIPVARETVAPAQYVGDPAKPGQPRTETTSFSPTETAALRSDLHLRDAARATRDRLLRTQEGGATLTPAQKQELSAAYHTITQVGERVGEAGARSYIEARYGPRAKEVFTGSGNYVFDHVFEVPRPGGGTDLVIVEAKGGAASLGDRQTPQGRVQQGHPDYLDATIESMAASKDSATQRMGNRLRDALDGIGEEHIARYVKAQTPIETPAGGTPTAVRVVVKEFDVGLPGHGSGGTR